MEGTEGIGNKHRSQQEPESLTLAIRESTAFPNLAIPVGWMFYRGLHVPCPIRFHQISTITQLSICTFHIKKLKLESLIMSQPSKFRRVEGSRN